MNNKKLVVIIGAVILVVGGYIAYRVISSRSLSPAETVTYSYGGLDLKVIYCRPFKRGRVIFGEMNEGALVPNGKYWRLGANSATEISLNKDVMVAGKLLKAGSYRMYAVPGQKAWEIAFNTELGKWGFDEPDYAKDILKVEVPLAKVDPAIEQFTISFSSNNAVVIMNLDWDNAHLSVPITMP